MPEHKAPPALLALMAGFLGLMAAAASVFWLAALAFGIRGAIHGIGPGSASLFFAMHIPAAIAGLLLWQWRRRELRPAIRVALEAATLYFWLAVLLGLLFNLLAASILDRLL